jgi:hypothetical protein
MLCNILDVYILYNKIVGDAEILLFYMPLQFFLGVSVD